MESIDFQEVQKHIAIDNVAYQLCLEITDRKNYEYKAICPFCGYNKLSKIPTLNLNITNNKYCCSRCGEGGYSVGLYAKVRGISTKKAYRELLDRECFSMDKSKVNISPINILADEDTRDTVYRAFLNKLKLDVSHKMYLRNLGFLDSTIASQMYRSIPKKAIARRILTSKLKKEYNLAGIPGFYQQEDFGWTFLAPRGFFVPVFDEKNRIIALSIHLDETFNETDNLWFSSAGRINGTGIKNIICRNNITDDTNSIILTDDLLLNNYIEASTNHSSIGFSQIANSYQILRAIEKTNIESIKFLFNNPKNQKLDYLTERLFKDLIPLGYNLDFDFVHQYKDVLDEDFIYIDTMKQVA